jgi:5,6,7,8-tetrahydromethanopterin hydro-lyase
MITKVTIKGLKQAVQMFGPAQAAVARAVADSVAEGVISNHDAENLVCVCGVFIHPQAADDSKIFEYNYAATKDALKKALANEPSVATITATGGGLTATTIQTLKGTTNEQGEPKCASKCL